MVRSTTRSRRNEGARVVDGKPGWQSDGSYLTPEGQQFTYRAGAVGLPAHGSGLDHPATDQDRAGRGGRRRHRGFEKQYHVQPDPMKLTCPRSCPSETSARALGGQQRQSGRALPGGQRRGLRRARSRPPGDHGGHRPSVVVTTTRRRAGAHLATSPRSGSGAICAPGRAARDGTRGRHRHRPDADRREQPHGLSRSRRQDGPRSGNRYRPASKFRPSSIARSWSRPRSRPLQKTSLKVPPSSSSSCFCCSATFARPSSQRS